MIPREILKINFSKSPFSCNLSNQALILSLKYGLYSCNFLTKMFAKSHSPSKNKIQKTRRISEAIDWSGLIVVYVLQYLPRYKAHPDFEACFKKKTVLTSFFISYHIYLCNFNFNFASKIKMHIIHRTFCFYMR